MIPQDQIRILTGVFLSIPLSFALQHIPIYSLRRYYSLVLGVLLEYYVYGLPLLISFALHIFVYFAIKGIRRENCGFYVTFVSMLFVSIYFIYVMIVDYGRWEMDISTILMMSVCKYSLFAYSYQDGQEEPNKEIINQQRMEQRLQSLPTFIDFFSYMVFLPGCLINNPFDYKTYSDFMKQEKQFSKIPQKQLLIKLGKEMIYMLICLGIYIFSTIYFPVSAFNQETYLNQGMLHHSWYSFVAINLLQTKYFFGFLLMQLPVHASGISFKPSENDQFEGIKTINIYGFLTAFHLRDKVNNWNMAVQQWLRRCVYERLPYDKSTNQLLTFMVSAFWHGFYPGYYVTFGLYFLQIYTSNLIFKFSRVNPDHPIIKLYRKTEDSSFYILWFIWNWIFVNNSAYFVVLSGKGALSILSLMNFSVPIFLILLILFIKIIMPKSQITKKDQ